MFSPKTVSDTLRLMIPAAHRAPHQVAVLPSLASEPCEGSYSHPWLSAALSGYQDPALPLPRCLSRLRALPLPPARPNPPRPLPDGSAFLKRPLAAPADSGVGGVGGAGTAVAPPHRGLVTEKHPPYLPALGPRIGLFPARSRPPPAFLGPGALVSLCCRLISWGLLTLAQAACIPPIPAGLGFVWVLDLPRTTASPRAPSGPSTHTSPQGPVQLALLRSVRGDRRHSGSLTPCARAHAGGGRREHGGRTAGRSPPGCELAGRVGA